MGEAGLPRLPSPQRGSWTGGEDLRIVVQGPLTADVLVELEGFSVLAAHTGLLLVGSIPDQAALGGALRRLRAAGLVITAVECRRPSFRVGIRADPDPVPPTSPPLHLARIEVDGSVPDEVEDLAGCVGRRTQPATTTLEFRLHDDDELFAVLDALEEWGLPLRTVITDR